MQPQLLHNLLCLLLPGVGVHFLRGVGITAEHHVAAFLCRHVPEFHIGVVSALPHTQEIPFQGHAAVFGCPADGARMLTVDLRISGKMDQIGMGQVGKGSGSKTLQHLIHVIGQTLFIGIGQGIENGFIIFSNCFLDLRYSFNPFARRSSRQRRGFGRGGNHSCGYGWRVLRNGDRLTLDGRHVSPMEGNRKL